MGDLLGFHESEPHNPKIAHVFFLAGLIERWGRGVQRIFSACKIDGVESPLYRMAGNSLQIVFTAPADRVMRIGVQQPGPGDIATHVPVDDGDGAVLTRLGATWRDVPGFWSSPCAGVGRAFRKGPGHSRAARD